MEKEGLCTFSNTADIQKNKRETSRDSRSIVIGGGLIGVAAAESLD